MDLSSTIVPKSDQLNSEDLLTAPVTVTIEDVRAGNAEQPVAIHLVEFPGRPFKPSKTVRRLLVAAWGKDSSVYVGRRMTLYRDPTVKWAGEAVGGIRVSHLSHIDKPLSVALTVTRGQRKAHVVEPLVEKPKPARSVEPESAPPELEPASGEQLRALKSALDAAGLTDREAALEFVSKQVGRDIDDPRALTKAEASTLLDTLST